MKLISWNVNGLRAVLGRGFLETMVGMDADVICLQETKMERGQAEVDLEGYHELWNSARKKGYSGTAVFTRTEPLAVEYGMGREHHDNEGRIIRAEYEDFILVNVYTPNSQRGLLRLDYRLQWEDDFRDLMISLDREKPLVICGDMNVAHQEIDIKNVSSNRKNAGFTDQERGKMTELLGAGFVDTFRALHPEKVAYSWWSYMSKARARNVGWRIDYFLVSQRLMPKVKAAEIHTETMGSDHCPVSLILNAGGGHR
jgi:exodeoxyribonuclease-3